MKVSISRNNSATRIAQTPRDDRSEKPDSSHSDSKEIETLEGVDKFGHSLTYPSDLVSTSYFSWRRFFPELSEIYDNQAAILEEAQNIHRWIPWPEDHFSKQSPETNSRDWTVFPLLHTFPAYDPSKKTWVESTCAHCPRTAELLRKLPNCTTALFSRLGAGTRLSSHTGWADLANHVLRIHICLDIPEEGGCGLNVDGEVQYHKQGSIIVFDDSKPHCAFNLSDSMTRTVLIIDLMRPKCLPLGTATGGMISGKSLFRKSPIQVEIVSDGPLWVEQPITIRLLVHKAPDSLHSNDDLQSAWAGSLPYLTANYSVTCDGHTVPVNHITQGSTQLCNPNIILSVSDEEKAKYLLSLVFETSISVDHQFLDKLLQLEVQLIYSNAEEGDAHNQGNNNNTSSSDMERNIRTLMDLNRQGKSLDTMTYRSLHAPDRSVIRQVTGKFKLSHPLLVDIRCRELNQNVSIVSILLQNATKDHLLSLQNIQMDLNHSVIDMERMWESILQTHKTFVQRLKNEAQERYSEQISTMSPSTSSAVATWLTSDYINNPSAMYLDETFDSYSSVDGTSTIAPTQAPLLFRQSTQNDYLLSSSSNNNNNNNNNHNNAQSAVGDTPRVLSLPLFQVTPFTPLSHFVLSPGEGKSLVYRVDRAPVKTTSANLSATSESTLDHLLTTHFPFLSTTLNISWQPDRIKPSSTTNNNYTNTNSSSANKFKLTCSQRKVTWSLGSQCISLVYDPLFSSLYPIPSYVDSLTALTPFFEPRYHTEILHRLHRMFLYGSASFGAHTASSASTSSSAATTVSSLVPSVPGNTSQNHATSVSNITTAVFAHISHSTVLHVQVEGSALFSSLRKSNASSSSSSSGSGSDSATALEELTIIVHNPHHDAWLRDLVFCTDANILASSTDDEHDGYKSSGQFTHKNSTNGLFSFHPSIVSIGDMAPQEKRAIVLQVQRLTPTSSTNRIASVSHHNSASNNNEAADSTFLEDLIAIPLTQFSIEVTMEIPQNHHHNNHHHNNHHNVTGTTSKRYRYRQVTPIDVLVSSDAGNPVI